MCGVARMAAERVALVLSLREVDVHGDTGIAVVQLGRERLQRSEHRREDEQTPDESEQGTIPNREHSAIIVRRRRSVKVLAAGGGGTMNSGA